MRDRRILAALLLFTLSFGALMAQLLILGMYADSAKADDWTFFLKLFPSAALPPLELEPGQYCFGDCSPSLPSAALWIGIASFLVGFFTLAYTWWTRKKPLSPK